MTGFGRGEAAGRGRAFTVEVQSVNHRFLEVRSRVPKRLSGLEPRIQQTIQDRFSRGHFEVLVLEKDLDSRGRTLRVVEAAVAWVDATIGQGREAVTALREQFGDAGDG